MDIPMLDEAEWSEVIALDRRSADRSISEQEREDPVQPMLDAYHRLTGFRETNPNAIWHHRLSMYGPPCQGCGKPLRTPEANLCAACGTPRS